MTGLAAHVPARKPRGGHGSSSRPGSRATDICVTTAKTRRATSLSLIVLTQPVKAPVGNARRSLNRFQVRHVLWESVRISPTWHSECHFRPCRSDYQRNAVAFPGSRHCNMDPVTTFAQGVSAGSGSAAPRSAARGPNRGALGCPGPCLCPFIVEAFICFRFFCSQERCQITMDGKRKDWLFVLFLQSPDCERFARSGASRLCSV